MRILLLCFICSTLNCAFSQNETSVKKQYNWFDNIVGIENTNLINGITFHERLKTLDEKGQYLISKLFKIGNITYNGQPYFDIQIKYDVFNDQIILSGLNNNGYFAIQLVKYLVNSFSLNERNFINSQQLKVTTNNTNNKGFFEVLHLNPNISLYKKHKKDKQVKKNDQISYLEFRDKQEYMLYLNNEIHPLNSKKNVLKLFPHLKKQINQFYAKNRALMAYDYDKFLIKLIQNLNLLSEEVND
ncbi:hypothetical protein MHTCC0001_12100 [Flavobacteriaceae bacterium MHTCC 0001]